MRFRLAKRRSRRKHPSVSLKGFILAGLTAGVIAELMKHYEFRSTPRRYSIPKVNSEAEELDLFDWLNHMIKLKTAEEKLTISSM